MKYKTLNPVRYKGQLHGTGVELDLDEKIAAPLLDCGAVAPQLAKEESSDKTGDSGNGSETDAKKAGAESGKAETKPEKKDAKKAGKQAK